MIPIANSGTAIISIIPNSLVDDFFVFGFIGGIVGYAYYIFAIKDMIHHKTSFWFGMYGLIVSGMLGGLLAIVFDRSIELAILVGLLNQILFLSITRAVMQGDFWAVIKEVLVKLLTGGTKT
jgi:hypothetical protein